MHYGVFILRNYHAWEKSGCQVIVQTYLTNKIAGFFKPYGSLGSAGKKI